MSSINRLSLGSLPPVMETDRKVIEESPNNLHTVNENRGFLSRNKKTIAIVSGIGVAVIGVGIGVYCYSQTRQDNDQSPNELSLIRFQLQFIQDQLTQNITAIGNQFLQATTSLQNQISALGQNITSLCSQTQNLQEEVSTLKEEVSSLNHTFGNFTQNIVSQTLNGTKELLKKLTFVKQ